MERVYEVALEPAEAPALSHPEAWDGRFDS